MMAPLLIPSEDPSLVPSFRPLCITSLLSRTLERILASRLVVFLRDKLSSKQCGHTSECSPMDAACAIRCTATTISKIYRNRKKGKHNLSTQVHGKSLVGYVDLTRAFCRLPHRAHFDRLAALGVPEYLICFDLLWLWGRMAKTFVAIHYPPPPSKPHISLGSHRDLYWDPYCSFYFMDTVIQTTQERIMRKLAQPSATYAMIVVHVDDVTILVGGLDSDRIYTLATELMQYIFSWCQLNDMELSSHSAIQWIYAALSSIITAVNRYDGTLPPITVRRDTMERPVLRLVNDRLQTHLKTLSNFTHKRPSRIDFWE